MADDCPHGAVTIPVLLCSSDDHHPEEAWAQLPATLDAPIPDGALLDDPEHALLWHAAFTWRATGDHLWWPHDTAPCPPTWWALTGDTRRYIENEAAVDNDEVAA